MIHIFGKTRGNSVILNEVSFGSLKGHRNRGSIILHIKKHFFFSDEGPNSYDKRILSNKIGMQDKCLLSLVPRDEQKILFFTKGICLFGFFHQFIILF